MFFLPATIEPLTRFGYVCCPSNAHRIVPLSDDSNFVPLLVLQSSGVVVILALVTFWPGDWNLARWVGLAITVPAAVLLLVARYQLGRSFAITPQARELVTRGVYSRIRNPMYVFSALLVLGLVLSLQKLILFVIPVIIAPVQVIRARQEARVLEEKFGDTYREYRKKTWF